LGRLHPEHFRIRDLDEAEARVVEALLECTDDNWIIMPTVRDGTEKPPVEIDIVVAHPGHGVAIIEVKGYVPEIRGGQWIGGPRGAQSPVAQLNNNRGRLRRRLEQEVHSVERFQVSAAIAFPNAAGIKGNVDPLDLSQDQLIWSTDLNSIDSSLVRLIGRGANPTLLFDKGIFSEIIECLRPDAEFIDDREARYRWALARLEDRSLDRVRALESLDTNRRVFVSGGAGSGKSRLATSWASRALQRNERVLYVCFNDPLGDEIRRKFESSDGVIVAGPFLREALQMPGIPDLAFPPDSASFEEKKSFWDETVHGHLHVHWPKVEERYDTIVVDEAQDFSPSWLAMLESLLDSDGPKRMLMVGDSAQELHSRGFVEPDPTDGWVHAQLGPNVRNTLSIAKLLRYRLDGPPAPGWLPQSQVCKFLPATTVAERKDAVQVSVEELLSYGFSHSEIAVVCLDTIVRDEIRGDRKYTSIESADDDSIVCETAHRLKGLEFKGVVLAASERWPVADNVIYVGVSRAIFGLIICGPVELGERLKMDSDDTVV